MGTQENREARPVTADYIKRFFEKQANKRRYLHKTSYGKGLGETYSFDKRYLVPTGRN